MKVKFFPGEPSRQAFYRYSDSFVYALEGDTLKLNSGDDVQLILLDNKALPTAVLSEVIDSINIIQTGIDSVFVGGKFAGFETDSLKYKKDRVINADLNVFNDMESWDESVKENSWSANLKSYEEIVHVYTFNVPDLFDTGR